MIKLRQLIQEIERIGQAPDEEQPDMPVNWDEDDIQMLHKWDVPTIRKFLGLPKTFAAVYPSIIDVDMLDPQLAEEDPEWNDEGGYDWDGFRIKRNGFPPVLLARHNNSLFIKDGNHRIKWAQESGYKTIAAWVVDFDIQKYIDRKK